jgi:molybdopterin molybdotransferase
VDFFSCMSLNDAEQLVRTNISCSAGVKKLSLIEAVNQISAEAILSGENLPPFPRSTVDGYAVKSSDTFGAEEGIPSLFTVVGEVYMGEPAAVSIAAGETAVIPTGGMLPEGADAVVMLEHTEQFDAQTVLVGRKAGPGENVIQRGEDIHTGYVILPAGHLIQPQHVGLLAACGHTAVLVREPLRVGIISTGDEIVDIRTEPQPGQIRDVNSYLLQAMLAELGCTVRRYGIIGDDYERLAKALSDAVKECQLVVLSGGSSVGRRDYTVPVINDLGSPGVLFHGVAVKPGKPTIFGLIGRVPVFGLPGHPAAAMTMFTRLVKPALAVLAGRTENVKRLFPARMVRNVASAPGRDDFLSVKVYKSKGQYWAEPVFGRSGIVSALAEADGIVHIPAEISGLYAGDEIEVELFR